MRSKRAHTLRDVAERVGVGPATVSVVINGSRSGTKVSERTREAILQAARELNYRPNALARSLRTSRTGIVGYFSGYSFIDPRNPYIAEVMAGLQSACAERGLDLLLYTPHAGHTAEEIAANLANGRLDGLILSAREDHPIVPLLVDSHLPVVAISDALAGVPSVVPDSAEGGRLQARHLHALGHRDVLYLPADNDFPSVREREMALRDEATALGIRVRTGEAIPGFRLPGEALPPIPAVDLAHLDASCTVVVVWDDGPAYRYLDMLAAAGRSDVSVIGYNGCQPTVAPRWDLTTVRAHWPTAAARAIAVLDDLIAGHDVAPLTILPIDLISGATATSPRSPISKQSPHDTH